MLLAMIDEKGEIFKKAGSPEEIDSFINFVL